MPALQHPALLHRVFRHANVLHVVRASERTLISNAQGRKAEGVIWLNLTNLTRMLNGFFVLAKLLHNDGQGRMGERIVLICSPYQRGGVYTGAFLFSAHYGILEEASWDELGDSPTSLANLLQEYQGIEDGFHPDDNPVNIPESSPLA